MTDLYARMRTIIGTTAQWAADDLVIGDGEIALEREVNGDIKAKVGDGVRTWSQLPYNLGGGGAGGLDIVAGDARYLQLTDIKAAGGAANADKVARLDGNGHLDGTMMPPSVLRAGDLTKTGGTAAQADKVPQLDAAGTLSTTLIPDLSGTYVPKTDLVTAGGTTTQSAKVPRLDANGRLSLTFLQTTLAGGAAAQSGFIPILDSNGKLADTLLDTIDVAANPAANGAAKLVLTSATGKIDNTLISLPGVLTLKGTIDPTDAAAVPANPALGDTYVVNKVGAVDAAWGAPASGQQALVGDLLIRLNNEWEVVSSTGNLAFLPIAGGTITGALEVNGATTMKGDVTLGDANTDALTVNAAADFNAAVNVDGAATFTSTLSVDGNVTLGNAATDTVTIKGITTFPDGTAAAPSITFDGSPTTGIFQPANDAVALSTSGVERMHVNAAGNVGIGTDLPSSKLTVLDGDIEVRTSSSGNISLSFNGTAGSLTVNSRTAPLIFGTDSTERMRVASNGNVGIGTSSPNAALEVISSAPFDVRTSGINVHSPRTYGNYGSFSYNGSTTFISSTYAGAGAGTYGDFIFLAYDAGNTPKERIHIDLDGRVGIGMRTSTYMLDVAGNIRSATVDDNPSIALEAPTGNLHALGYHSTYSGSALKSYSAGYGGLSNFSIDATTIRLWTNTIERMRIDSAGNVGIGTNANAPNARLEVLGPTANKGSVHVNDGTVTIYNGATDADLLHKAGFEVGTRKLPLRNNNTTDAADTGGGILATTDVNVTPLSVGDIITVINADLGSQHNLVAAGVTMNLAGSGASAASLTMDSAAVATLIYVTANQVIVTGQGVH